MREKENSIGDMLYLYKKVMSGDENMEFFKDILERHSMFGDSGIDAMKEEGKTCKRRKLKF